MTWLLFGTVGFVAGFILAAAFGLWFVVLFAAVVGVTHWGWFRIWHGK